MGELEPAQLSFRKLTLCGMVNFFPFYSCFIYSEYVISGCISIGLEQLYNELGKYSLNIWQSFCLIDFVV